MPRKCWIHPDTFCYLCGELTFKSQRRNFTSFIKKYYELYFGCKVCDQDKSWALHICCVTYVRLPTGWVNVTSQTPFAVSIDWREPTDNPSDCYLCLTNLTGITSKSKHTVKFPDFPSAIRAIPHREELSVPEPPESKILAMTTLISWIRLEAVSFERGKVFKSYWIFHQS
jgi:hypothetical protein